MTSSRPSSEGPLATGFNHIAVITQDLDRACAFYAGVFDAEVLQVPDLPGTRGAMVRLGPSVALVLTEVLGGSVHAEGSIQSLQRGHLDHFGFDVPDAAALEAVRRRLIERGASDGTVSDYGSFLSVYFVDPDGMASEVCWVRDRSLSDLHPPVPFAGLLASSPDA